MEDLVKLLHKLQFDYYDHGANMHTIIPDSDIKPILEYIKNNFFPLGAPVKPEIADKLKELLRQVYEVLIEAPELNMGNYNEEEVRKLNDKMIEAYCLLNCEEKQFSV